MKIIDLTKTIENDMEVYPGDPEVIVEQVQTIDTHGWNLSRISFGTHTGTHVDAFSHMVKGGLNIDEIPLYNFLGKCRLVTFDDNFPKDIGLIFNSHIDVNLFDKIIGANPKFIGGNLSVELERKLLESNIITYTDLINLDQLPVGEDFFFIGLPLKIKQGDGSPIRAIAIIDLK